MRFFLLILLISLFVECNTKTNKEISTKLTDNVVSESRGKLPIFKDTYVSEYVKEYDKFLRHYFVALKGGRKSQLEQLRGQSVELIEKAKIVSSKLRTHAEVERFQKWLNEQNKKIQLLDSLK